MLPILGSDDDVADLQVDGDLLRLGDLALPIAPDSGQGTGPEVHDRQHYRLVGWRSGIVGYRRFFSITSLAGLRQEDRAVFDASHAEVARWFSEGLVDGVRIDHPDGLADPSGYLAWLRDLLGPDAWIVIEKILAVDEALEPTLPINGTTGYDVLREVGGVFVDPAGATALTELVTSAGVDFHATPMTVGGPQDSRGHRYAGQRAAPAAPQHRRGRRHGSPSCCPRRWPHCSATSRSTARDYPGLAAVLPTALAETQAAQPELAPALQVHCGGAGAAAASPPPACNNCAAR